MLVPCCCYCCYCSFSLFAMEWRKYHLIHYSMLVFSFYIKGSNNEDGVSHMQWPCPYPYYWASLHDAPIKDGDVLQSLTCTTRLFMHLCKAVSLNQGEYKQISITRERWIRGNGVKKTTVQLPIQQHTKPCSHASECIPVTCHQCCYQCLQFPIYYYRVKYPPVDS